MKLKYVLLTAVVASFMACQKEPDSSILTQPNSACKLDKAVFFDTGGALTDTAAYVYTGTQVTRVNYIGYFITLDYTNSKVSKRSFRDYSSPDSAFLFDQFIYNSDGTLSIEQDYANGVPGISGPFLYKTFNYTYSGGKLVQFITKEDTTGSGVMVATLQSDYTYTGNNISKSITKDLTSGQADTLTYSYDSKQNYYIKNAALFYTDDLFLDAPGEILPLAVSGNNVTGVGQGGTSSIITYSTDSKQNFIELDINGQKAVVYSYKCQ